MAMVLDDHVCGNKKWEVVMYVAWMAEIILINWYFCYQLFDKIILYRLKVTLKYTIIS